MSHLLVQVADRLLDLNAVCYLVHWHFCDSWKWRQYLLLLMTALIWGHLFVNQPNEIQKSATGRNNT